MARENARAVSDEAYRLYRERKVAVLYLFVDDQGDHYVYPADDVLPEEARRQLGLGDEFGQFVMFRENKSES